MKKVSAARRRRQIRTTYRYKVRTGAWRYSRTYDAYYNAKTREWVEPKCGDRACEFCAKRPPIAPKVRAASTGAKKRG